MAVSIRTSMIRHSVDCNGCSTKITSIRYKCKQCREFNLCTKCKGMGLHKQLGHLYFEIGRSYLCNECGRFINVLDEETVHYKCFTCVNCNVCEICRQVGKHSTHNLLCVEWIFGTLDAEPATFGKFPADVKLNKQMGIKKLIKPKDAGNMQFGLASNSKCEPIKKSNVAIKQPVDHQEKNSGYKIPVAEINQQPVGVNKHPVVEVKQPVEDQKKNSGYKIPVAGINQQPVGVRQPVVGVRQPVVGVKQPVVGVKQPVVGVKQPVVGVQQPLVGVKQPVVGAKQPVVGVKQPVVGAKQPVVGVKQPVVVVKQPVVGVNKQPVVGVNKQPVVGVNKQPVVGVNKQPVVGVNKLPVVGVNKQPVVEVNKPPVVEVNKQPVVGVNKQPVVGVNKPPVVEVNKQPVVGVNKLPVVGVNKQPVVEVVGARVQSTMNKQPITMIRTRGVELHSGVSCIGCHMSPIRGIRFKCAQCENFNCCEFCKNKVAHKGHSFLSVKSEQGRISQTSPLCNPWETERDLVQWGKELGSGSFGKVSKGSWKGMPVAIKVLQTGAMDKEAFIREAEIMSTLKHNNITTLLAVVSRNEPVLIITEYMNRGSLSSYLRKNINLLPMRTLIWIAMEVADGMRYLESKTYVHRDLAARNVLVGTGDNCSMTIKICDFGLTRLLHSREESATLVYQSTSDIFPPRWTAPEAMPPASKFTVKSDVWSFGILLTEIVTFGQCPYSNIGDSQIPIHVKSGNIMQCPVGCPPPLYSIMKRTWAMEPRKRPSFQDIMPWLQICFEM